MKRHQKENGWEQRTEALLSPLDGTEMLARVSGMSQPLLSWYREHGRVLPWREKAVSGDINMPYYIWLSEIMLQQTRVETVIPYYQRFLEAVPDIPSLAAADDQLLHKLWEGLGYYSRVRNLKKGAMQVMEQYGGQLPASIPLLRDICGIGDYTAGAIGSIAFGLKEPAVDGNLLRVTSRLLATEGDIGKPAVKKAFHDLLLEGMPSSPSDTGDFNQAMMDLGAGLCVPGTPECGNCPISRYCFAYERGQAELFPVKAKRAERKIQFKTVLVILTGKKLNTVLLRQREESGLLAGLWEFPMEDGYLSAEEVREKLKSMGLIPERVLALKDAKHLFTHIEWQMKGFLVYCPEGDFPSFFHLATQEQLEKKYTLPSAFRVYRAAAVSRLKRAENFIEPDGSVVIQEELL